jgi:hypothetical protein
MDKKKVFLKKQGHEGSRLGCKALWSMALFFRIKGPRPGSIEETTRYHKTSYNT